jgi:hypothetical protein
LHDRTAALVISAVTCRREVTVKLSGNLGAIQVVAAASGPIDGGASVQVEE